MAEGYSVVGLSVAEDTVLGEIEEESCSSESCLSREASFSLLFSVEDEESSLLSASSVDLEDWLDFDASSSSN